MSGTDCLAMRDHSEEYANDAAYKEIGQVETIEQQKLQYVRDIGRRQQLEDLERRVSSLVGAGERREYESKAHALDHVQQRLKFAEQSAAKLAKTTEKQAELVQNLRLLRARGLRLSRTAEEATAKRVVAQARAAAVRVLAKVNAKTRRTFPHPNYRPHQPPHPLPPSRKRARRVAARLRSKKAVKTGKKTKKTKKIKKGKKATKKHKKF